MDVLSKNYNAIRACLTAFFICTHFFLSGQINLDSSLVVHMPFSGNAFNVSNNTLNVTTVGVNLTYDRFNRQDEAYEFVGSQNSYIKVDNTSVLNISGNFSVSLWINKKLTTTAVAGVIYKGQDIRNGFHYYINTSGEETFTIRDGSNISIIKGKYLTQNNCWYHVVLMLRDGKLQYYIDGVKVDEVNAYSANHNTNNNYPLVIGRHFTYADGTGPYQYPFKGELDDIRLYDRALSLDEIAFLFNENSYTSCDAIIAEFDADTVCVGFATRFINKSIGSVTSTLWNFGDNQSGNANFSNLTNPTHVFSAAGIFNVTLIISNGIKSDTLVKSVYVKDKPVVNTKSSLTKCYNDTIQLNAIGGIKYKWHPPDYLNDPFIENPLCFIPYNSFYTVTVENLEGCYDSTIVSIQTEEPKTIINSPVSACKGSEISIFASGADNFVWNNTDTGNSLILLLDSTTEISVVGFNGNCLSKRYNFVIHIEDCILKSSYIWIPNSFSPNNDLINDKLEIVHQGIISFDLQIYSRWGELLFHTIDVNEFWDGTYNGRKVMSGNYFYIYKASGYDGNLFKDHGVISVIN